MQYEREWKRAEYLRQKAKIAAMDPETYREYRKRKKAEAETQLKKEGIRQEEALQNQTEQMISKADRLK